MKNSVVFIVFPVLVLLGCALNRPKNEFRLKSVKSSSDIYISSSSLPNSFFINVSSSPYVDPNEHWCNDLFEKSFVLYLPNLKTKIHYVSQKVVDAHCLNIPVHDDGTKTTPGDWFLGCIDKRKDRTDIWIRYCTSPEVLMHELCHFDGSYTIEECDLMLPGRFE